MIKVVANIERKDDVQTVFLGLYLTESGLPSLFSEQLLLRDDSTSEFSNEGIHCARCV